jgi:hypothetical protein
MLRPCVKVEFATLHKIDAFLWALRVGFSDNLFVSYESVGYVLVHLPLLSKLFNPIPYFAMGFLNLIVWLIF